MLSPSKDTREGAGVPAFLANQQVEVYQINFPYDNDNKHIRTHHVILFIGQRQDILFGPKLYNRFMRIYVISAFMKYSMRLLLCFTLCGGLCIYTQVSWKVIGNTLYIELDEYLLNLRVILKNVGWIWPKKCWLVQSVMFWKTLQSKYFL